MEQCTFLKHFVKLVKHFFAREAKMKIIILAAVAYVNAESKKTFWSSPLFNVGEIDFKSLLTYLLSIFRITRTITFVFDIFTARISTWDITHTRIGSKFHENYTLIKKIKKIGRFPQQVH
jgi:hypothetical protein